MTKSLLFLFSFCFVFAQNENKSNATAFSTVIPVATIEKEQKSPVANHKIQIALLLDTSNSMDGLIEQAKSQLWKMVNQLASAKKDNQNASIEIALFEYGNATLNADKGYIRMVKPLISDMDAISDELFKLKTNGGEEYCGWVMNDAIENLRWTESKYDLKLIIIAGNEAFNQGPKDPAVICKATWEKGISVNTIFCGNYEEGIRTGWKAGADCAQGKYLNIEQDKEVHHIETPWDEEIIRCNDRLNKTYLSYGAKGEEMKLNQAKQDSNAGSYGKANVAVRASFKAKEQYRNDAWDLVDATEKDKKVLETAKEDDLPAEMKKMSATERSAYVEKLRSERESIKKEIVELGKKISAFTAESIKNNPTENTLDKAMLDTVTKQAKEKGFEF
jgi:hypothetical protein